MKHCTTTATTHVRCVGGTIVHHTPSLNQNVCASATSILRSVRLLHASLYRFLVFSFPVYTCFFRPSLHSCCSTNVQVLRGRVAFSLSTAIRLTPDPKCLEVEDDAVRCVFEADSEGAANDWYRRIQQVGKCDVNDTTVFVARGCANLRQPMNHHQVSVTLFVDQRRACIHDHHPTHTAQAVENYQRVIADAQENDNSADDMFTQTPRGALSRRPSQRLRDAVLNRRAATNVLKKQQQQQQQQQQHNRSDDGSAASSSLSHSSSSSLAEEDDHDGVPTIGEAMSTCKKRAPSRSMRMVAAVERENAQLRAALAAQNAQAATAGEDPSKAQLQTQLEELQRRLQAQLVAQSLDEAAATATATAAPKTDKALAKRRMNIEAHHETCKCVVM